jgi:hypothetical protein
MFNVVTSCMSLVCKLKISHERDVHCGFILGLFAKDVNRYLCTMNMLRQQSHIWLGPRGLSLHANQSVIVHWVQENCPYSLDSTIGTVCIVLGPLGQGELSL